MFRYARAALSATLLAAAGIAFAQDTIDQGGGAVRYEEHRLVHVELTTPEQLDLLEELDAIVLDCRIGVGPLEIVIAPDALDELRAAGIEHVVRHENVQALVDAERARLAAQGGVAGLTDVCDDAWFDDFKPLADVNDRIDDLVATYPDFVEKIDVGTTIEGRTIHAMRVSAPGAAPGRPAVMITGCQHAREWVAPMVPMYIATRLACGSAEPDILSMLEEVEFFIVPIVNPDGYEYSWTTERFWRKNRRLNFPTSDYGVDLNRNWGVDWGGPESTSTDPGSDVFIGEAAFSEPESAAVRDFILARPQIVSHIDFHSYSQVILQSWAHTNDLPADFLAIDALGGLMTQATFDVNGVAYPHASGDALLYLASGVMPDWTYGTTGAFAYTIELRPSGFNGGGFELPPDQIFDTCTENFAAVMAMGGWAQQGVQFLYPAGRPEVVPSDQEAVLPIDLAETYETVQAGSPRLLARVGTDGAFTSTSLTSLGGDSYEATLPAAPCGEVVQYYVELETDSGDTYRDPIDAPDTVFETLAVDAEVLAAFDLEIDPGWSVSGDAQAGAWELGVPAGGGDRGDPATDFDGSGACYLTENGSGNTDVDDGTTILTTGAFDLAGGGTLSYAFWLNDIEGGALGAGDAFEVEVATDAAGASWTSVRRHDTPQEAWRTDTIAIDADAATSTVRFRFSVSDVGDGNVVEGGLDAVVVSRFDCEAAPCAADVAGDDGVVDVVDLLALLGAWGSGDPIYDINEPPDGAVDVADLLAMLAQWGPCE